MLKNHQGLYGAQRLLFIQGCISLVISIISLVSINMRAAISAIAGGTVCILPNAYFAIKLFEHSGARSAKKIVNGFYKGEAIKLLLSVALFALVFKYLTINPLVFFISYISAQLVFWLAPYYYDKT